MRHRLLLLFSNYCEAPRTNRIFCWASSFSLWRRPLSGCRPMCSFYWGSCTNPSRPGIARPRANGKAWAEALSHIELSLVFFSWDTVKSVRLEEHWSRTPEYNCIVKLSFSYNSFASATFLVRIHCLAVHCPPGAHNVDKSSPFMG